MGSVRKPEWFGMGSLDDASLAALHSAVRYEVARRGGELAITVRRCPMCGDRYGYRSPGGTDVWQCGHAIGK